MRITVVRAIPPVIIGTVGIVPNHEFEAFEARLDAVESSGAIVERLQPDQAAQALGRRLAVRPLVASGGAHAFPLVLVNDEIVSSGRYPTNTEWAHALGTASRILHGSGS